MGYRLSVYETKYIACGGKLYGYYAEDFDELMELPSFKWLVDNGYLNSEDNQFFWYSNDNQIAMRVEDLLKFLELYKEDYVAFNNYDRDSYEYMDRLIETVKSKSPFEKLIIDWG